MLHYCLAILLDFLTSFRSIGLKVFYVVSGGYFSLNLVRFNSVSHPQELTIGWGRGLCNALYPV